MKLFPLALALLMVVSCNEPEQKGPKATTPIIPIKKDSGLTHQELSNPYAPIDISPVDISYFPVDFPIAKMSHKAPSMPIARVIYSRPHRQGRKIFGSLLKYGEPWRLGANEASEIEFFRPVTIQKKKVPAGRYIIYCIPEQDHWTVVLNSNLYTWGLKLDPQKDLYRFQIPVQQTTTPIEYFTMIFEQTTGGADLLMAWDEVVARLPFSF